MKKNNRLILLLFLTMTIMACLGPCSAQELESNYATCKKNNLKSSLLEDTYECTCKNGSTGFNLEINNRFFSPANKDSIGQTECVSTLPAGSGSLFFGDDNFQNMEENRQVLSERALNPLSGILSFAGLSILMMVSFPKVSKKLSYAWSAAAGLVSVLLVYFNSGK